MAHLNLKPKTGVPPVRADMPLSCQMKRQARSPSAMTGATPVFQRNRLSKLSFYSLGDLLELRLGFGAQLSNFFLKL